MLGMGTAATVIVAALVGVLLWTFAEYGFHNWVGHQMKGRVAGSREHLRHHAERGYFAPWTYKLRSAVLLALLTIPLLSLLIGPAAAVAGGIGFYGMYLAYELVHRRLHTHPPRHAYARFLRIHHFGHHFRHPKENHGVTTPIWDLLLGTYTRVELPLRVPRRHAMDWLVDPNTGALRDEFASDYVLVGKTRAT